MKKEEYLNIVTKQIRYIFDRKYIEAELKDHLEDSIQELMEEGCTNEEAEAQAVFQMGDPVETGRMLNKEHHPVIGYFYAVSNVLLILAGIYFILVNGMLLWGLIETANPIVAKNSVGVYSVNKEVKIPTHRISIDNICLCEDGTYILTSRNWRENTYSHAQWSTKCFNILGTDGEQIERECARSDSGLSGWYKMSFDRPEDDILILEFKDGQTCRLDMKEYLHE